MYLDDTMIAPAGSWRAAKIEKDLILDIASAIAGSRVGDCDQNRPYMPEAERWLRMFIAEEGRYPADCLEVDDRFPGCFEHGIKLRLAT
jgi:hypothetical protein